VAVVGVESVVEAEVVTEAGDLTVVQAAAANQLEDLVELVGLVVWEDLVE